MNDSYITSNQEGYLQIFLRTRLQKTPKGVVVIAHGIAESLDTHETLANRIYENGYSVYSYDHRGHGRSSSPVKGQCGIANKNGDKVAIEDLKQIIQLAKSENPNVPVYAYGFSWGSYLVRNVLYDNIIDGAIIMGSGPEQPFIKRVVGRGIAWILSIIFGNNYPSYFIEWMAFGDFRKQKNKEKTKFDWIAADSDGVKVYIDSPFCGKTPTSTTWFNLGNTIISANDTKKIDKVSNKSIPLFLLAGEHDATIPNGVGGFNKLVDMYRKSGFSNVSSKLYPNVRHCLLLEKNADAVIDDILAWLVDQN